VQSLQRLVTETPVDKHIGEGVASRQPLGQLLLSQALITEEQLEAALSAQKGSGLRLGEQLVKMGFLREEELLRVLAEQLGLRFCRFGEMRADREAARFLPEEMARSREVAPVGQAEGRLLVAVSDPSRWPELDDVSLRTGMEVEPVLVSRDTLARMLEELYGRSPAEEEVLPESAVELVERLIVSAVEEEASDLHLDPQEEGVAVRFRVDGRLRDLPGYPVTAHPPVVSRVKILAGLDIAEKRLPQEGRIRWEREGRMVDLRVATLPTPYGEKVTIRILDQSRSFTSISALGMDPTTRARWEQLISRPFGMILVSGPTGSGKTSTLTATIHYLNRPDRHILTIEDPVEYRIPGVNQIQVNQKIGFGFAQALRSFLRHDPDVIMVGEVRDQETAEIAVRAALTGHLVFSTIHTQTAPSAVTRLLEMGVEPYLVASAVSGVLSQRLLRRLCPHCREPFTLSPDAPERLALGIPEGEELFFRPRGCERCRGTGYRGRVAVFELLAVSREMRKLILGRPSQDELVELALREGMKILLQSALEKAREGETSLEEALSLTWRE